MLHFVSLIYHFRYKAVETSILNVNNNTLPGPLIISTFEKRLNVSTFCPDPTPFQILHWFICILKQIQTSTYGHLSTKAFVVAVDTILAQWPPSLFPRCLLWRALTLFISNVVYLQHPEIHPLASHAGVFRGAGLSSLPTNACSTKDNIPFPSLANHIVLSKFWKVDLDHRVI